MTWLNSNDYTTHTPDSYDNEDRNIPQKQNYVYGNDQYEGSLYLAAWLLGNDTNFIDDTYTSVDARETWAEADNWRESNWEDSGNYDSDGDGLIDTFVTEDYGINRENFVEAYAAFLAYGSDWNGNSYFSGSPEGESSKGGFAAMLNGRCVFYGVGTWDLQQFNNTSIDKLNVGIMPTPVSEDYAIASKVKDYQYKAAYYYNDYYGTLPNIRAPRRATATTSRGRASSTARRARTAATRASRITLTRRPRIIRTTKIGRSPRRSCRQHGRR